MIMNITNNKQTIENLQVTVISSCATHKSKIKNQMVFTLAKFKKEKKSIKESITRK